jgi:2-aminobenzoate-CoA ligase
MGDQAGNVADVDTAADDTALIAFTSGTTGKPKAAVHFHRDLIAACDCWPPAMLRAGRGDVFTGSPPPAFTFDWESCCSRCGSARRRSWSNGLRRTRCSPSSPRSASACLSPRRRRIARWPARPGTTTFIAASACRPARRCLPPRKLWKDATGIEIIDGIGATEMFHIFISHDSHAKPGAVGTVVPGYRAAIMDDDGNRCRRAPSDGSR